MTTGRINQVTMVQNESIDRSAGACALAGPPVQTSTQCAEAQGVIKFANQSVVAEKQGHQDFDRK